MKFLVFIFIFLFFSKINAQNEFNSKFKLVAPKFNKKKIQPKTTEPTAVDTDLKNFPSIKAPNIFEKNELLPLNPKYQIGKKTNVISLIPKNEFENPGNLYKDKMQKNLDKTLKEGQGPLDMKNRYIGDFKTKSKYININYRDYIMIDGDLLDIYQNGQKIKSALYLAGHFQSFKINLTEGINDLEFVVLSTGTSGGNTAELHFIDEFNNEITNQFWDNLGERVKIKIIIEREN